jgi:microcystin-dependent protein
VDCFVCCWRAEARIEWLGRVARPVGWFKQPEWLVEAEFHAAAATVRRREAIMGQPFVGEIRMFGGNFAPNGWMFCNGALLSIAEFETLFNLIGTTYGGDGQQTFALPNLQSRVPIHMGADGLGNNYVEGQPGGVESVTLAAVQVGAHNHALRAVSSGASVASPANALPGVSLPTQGGMTSLQYGNLTATPTTLDSSSISQSAGGQPHSNIQPYLAVSFIISMFGIFPSQS